MSFVFAFALAGLVLVAAPYFAHRLRRRRADSRFFAPAHLVPPAPVRARRKAALEDRALFATRALAVIGLALLGASPLVRCSRLALNRSSGASVALAIVLDDSMSMRAKLGDRTRFARARSGAIELLGSTREGDAVAIILAGDPARVALAPTTDLRGARALLESLPESDRATDLDGAIAVARGLVEGLPQADRRVVVLSDLADGHPDAPPLGEGSSVPVWNALPEIRADGHDCAVIRADRSGLRVRVRVACTPGNVAPRTVGRTVALYLGEKAIVDAAAPAGATGDVVLSLPADSLPKGQEPGALVARLLGGDAIDEDDAAPVIAEAIPSSIAVVVPSDSEIAATGGPPVVEQALRALQLDVTVRPLPQIPDRVDDLAAFAGVLLDDPPGFTPEERRALGAFVERGGLVLVALGPRASTPPLGATLEPFVMHPLAWEASAPAGVDPATATPSIAESAASLVELGARHRTVLGAEDAAAFTTLLAWSDRAPLVAERAVGRGEAWIVTLPFALDASDLPVRPAFLALLDAWIDVARARTVPRRTEVGVAWTFPDSRKVTAIGPGGDELPVAQGPARLQVTPPRLGLYRVVADGRVEVRVAQPASREVDLRPRRVAVAAASRVTGETVASVDASPTLACFLLALFALELGLRLRAGRDTDPSAPPR